MAVPRSAKISGIVVASLFALALIAIGSLWLIQGDKVLPNTRVAGIDVGGMSADEVRAALAPTADEREHASIVFTFEGDEHRLLAREVGYTVDVEESTRLALARGREGLPGDVIERLRSLRTRHDVPLIDEHDSGAVTAWVADLAAELDREESVGSVNVDPSSLEVQVELPSGYVEVQQDEVVAELTGALSSGGSQTFELAVETADQPVSDEDVQAAAEQVTRAVSGPLELRSGDASLTLEPRDIARIIEVREAATADGLTLELVVDADAVGEVMGEVASGRFETDPVDAAFVADREPPVSFDDQGSTAFQPVEAAVDIEPGRDGTRFNAEMAAEQLTILLRDGARTAELRLETIEPELSNEAAEELRPTHLLGTFTTYFTAGQARSHNIRFLADEIDGTVVMPGDQFSINETSGRRTCERGYLEAGTIVQGELQPTCGGGTSQFGTTTFNAAFFAGVKLDQWKAHSWYISRYPMGREATLNYPELDVRFTNTTPGALLVKTAHTSSSVTVSVYGQPIATRVSATHGSPTNPTSYSTERRQSSALGPGQENVLQAGGGGFTVEVVRTIEMNGGGTETETIRTVYVPQTRIVEYGPPAPRSTDDDEDDDEDD